VLDLVLRNGRVIDGTGNPWFKADVGIREGKIAAVGDLTGAEARRAVDVAGLVVTPGFMDPHSHTDCSALKNSEALTSIQQGITTEFVGNCGMSPYFPITDRNRETAEMELADLFEADLGEMTVDWADLAGFRRQLEKKGGGTNLACFVGHNNVRSAVMGEEGEGGERNDPSAAELAEMKQLVAQAMAQGAWGMTTGLVYKPGRNAKTEEIVELARVAAEAGGSYMSHIRGYRSLDGLEEFLEIVEKAPVRGVLSHYSARCHTEKKQLVGPMPEELLGLVDKSRAKGSEIYMDVLPWGGYSSSSMIHLLLETKDKFDEGGKLLTRDRFMEMLRQPEKRKAIEERARRRAERTTKLGEEAEKVEREFGDMFIVNRSIRFPEYVGHSLAEIAKMRGVDLVTAAVDILLEDEGNTFWGSWQCEADLKQIIQHPAAMVSTDGSALEKDPPLVSLRNVLYAPAVRLYGSFAKVLGSYVREDRLFPLEEAIRKMTSLPARAIGLKNRGLIRPGMWADVCVFDPDRIAHMATYFEPRQHCVGIEYVLVNGEFALKEGQLTGARAGKVLRHEVV
jgi:N-acyl-D-amino-acid deacylase